MLGRTIDNSWFHTQTNATLVDEGAGVYKTSAGIDITGYRVVGIRFPSGWTTSDINFLECTTSGGTYMNIYDTGDASTDSAKVLINSAVASSYIPLNIDAFNGVNFIKVSSVTDQTSAKVPVLYLEKVIS